MFVVVGRRRRSRMLLTASQNGDVRKVRRLSKLGANVNTAMKDGATSAFVASVHGHEKVVHVLHRLGADLNIAKNNGVTPVYAASLRGHKTVVRVLHRLGADLNIADNKGATPVYAASLSGQKTVVRLLSDLGADVAESGRLGRAQLLDKGGSTGQMQISAELVPIPDASGCVRMRPGCVPDASGF